MEYKIIWLLAVCDFELLERCFKNNEKFVDEIYLRFDKENTSQKTIDYLMKFEKVKGHIFREKPGSNNIWREELLSMPKCNENDIIMTLDIDETISEEVVTDINSFYKSRADHMLIGYNVCPSEDNSNSEIYPTSAHMKFFKWKKGISYLPYYGYAQISQYANKKHRSYATKHKIDHYCMWTKEMKKTKIDSAIRKYGKL